MTDHIDVVPVGLIEIGRRGLGSLALLEELGTLLIESRVDLILRDLLGLHRHGETRSDLVLRQELFLGIGLATSSDIFEGVDFRLDLLMFRQGHQVGLPGHVSVGHDRSLLVLSKDLRSSRGSFDTMDNVSANTGITDSSVHLDALVLHVDILLSSGGSVKRG